MGSWQQTERLLPQQVCSERCASRGPTRATNVVACPVADLELLCMQLAGQPATHEAALDIGDVFALLVGECWTLLAWLLLAVSKKPSELASCCAPDAAVSGCCEKPDGPLPFCTPGACIKET